MCTPAPWWIDDDGFIASGTGDAYKTIANVGSSPEDERDANARLIAAAPELLAALKRWVFVKERANFSIPHYVRAAIAAAEGE